MNNIKLTSPNGKAFITVSEDQAQNLEAKGFKRVSKKGKTRNKKASTKLKDTAKNKAISQVSEGDTRTQ